MSSTKNIGIGIPHKILPALLIRRLMDLKYLSAMFAASRVLLDLI